MEMRLRWLELQMPQKVGGFQMLRGTIAVSFLFLSAPAFADWHGSSAQDAPRVVGALGDSISAGFNAKHLGDNRDLSWATGDSPLIRSHLRRLEEYFQTQLVGVNESIAGSVASNLARQTSRLLPRHPAYVTIDIGANDVCTWTPDGYEPALAQFEKDVGDTIRRIITAEPDVSITLAPIPNVYQLWDVAVAMPGCQLKWDITGFCSPLLDSSRTEADRQSFIGRWQEANDALARVAADFPEHVLFDENAIDTPFTWEHVSPIDCFHPSIAGQNLLAEKTWLYGR